ncbi:hypothetical protein ACFSJS_19295 [Streptomyces desertarenae]|uniref:Uncharacterized protein n=1 Tax=Streptomyces desertarenae TaxID=2666184 RepID=A0ABW4PP72_9ACTN
MAATAARPAPRARTARAKAKEVLEAGSPAADESARTCSCAPSQPKTKLAVVQAGLVLADQPGRVQAHLDGDERRPRQVEGDVVGHPPPQLAVECEVEGGDDADTALRVRPAEERDIHEHPWKRVGAAGAGDGENRRKAPGRRGRCLR